MSLPTQKQPIEFKLQLTGPSANNDTLHDLLTWLEQEEIEGVTFKRQEVPTIPGKMGGLDPYIILALILATPPALDSGAKIIGQFSDSLSRWRKLRNIEPHDLNPQTLEEEFEKKIKTFIEEQSIKPNIKNG